MGRHGLSTFGSACSRCASSSTWTAHRHCVASLPGLCGRLCGVGFGGRGRKLCPIFIDTEASVDVAHLGGVVVLLWPPNPFVFAR
ncbi:hypothetical protein GQ55_5G337500 [Panicum hallii var. hallii]|uniref:Uncharacterized protein n=1 Tax=Panicum hallii var. hallii TaxID=1504633 RepID=A0A2T7DLZ7_9POAL|nr:hypothetical protein GQ55_5G337500 [Panicum hallii var. hallii]